MVDVEVWDGGMLVTPIRSGYMLLCPQKTSQYSLTAAPAIARPRLLPLDQTPCGTQAQHVGSFSCSRLKWAK